MPESSHLAETGQERPFLSFMQFALMRYAILVYIASDAAYHPSVFGINQMHHEDIALAFQWIVERIYPTHPKQKPHFIRIEVGRDNIEEAECALNENIVSISDAGIFFWYRPYSQPGAPSFASARVWGLFGFMQIVVWPRIVGDWVGERLMLEADLNEAERVAVDLYRNLEKEEKELNVRDIEKLLEDKPHLLRLFSAVRNSNTQELQKYGLEPPGEFGEIGTDQILVLAEAIKDDDKEKISAQKHYLIFRILHIAAAPLILAGESDWHSREYREKCKKTLEQITYVGRLARRRYAKEFMAFCLTTEMLEIKSRLFQGDTEGGQDDYCARVSSFVNEKLALAEYAS